MAWQYADVDADAYTGLKWCTRDAVRDSFLGPLSSDINKQDDQAALCELMQPHCSMTMTMVGTDPSTGASLEA